MCAVLHVPAQDDLGRGPLVLGGDPGDRLVLERLAVVSERAVRLDGDPVAPARLARRVVVEVGVDLELVDGRDDPVSSMIRSRWAGWKFETPALRSRPSATNSVSARQVET